jgi:hypothetical protein
LKPFDASFRVIPCGSIAVIFALRFGFDAIFLAIGLSSVVVVEPAGVDDFVEVFVDDLVDVFVTDPPFDDVLVDVFVWILLVDRPDAVTVVVLDLLANFELDAAPGATVLCVVGLPDFVVTGCE